MTAEKIKERGFGCLELLVTIFVAAILMLGVTGTLLNSTGQYHDQQIISETEERAKMLLDSLAFELRLLGAGLPLGQENFSLSDATLADAPLPITLDATTNNLRFRLDELGTNALLDADFTPSVLNLDIAVNSTNGFAIGETIYISDFIVGGENGFRGEITGLTSTVISVDSDYISSAGATFKAGSILSKVSEVVISQIGSAVTRSVGASVQALAPNSAVNITYLDASGSALALPLTASVVQNSLTSLRLEVTLASDSLLNNGETYQALAAQEIGLRNLRLGRI